MKILFMADVAPDKDSGAAGTEYQTIEAIRALGHDVDTVWADELPHRISHWNLHYLLELPRAYDKLMMERIRQTHYDVVHVNQPHGYRAARSLARLKTKSIFVHRSHGLEMRTEMDLKPWQEKYGADNRSSSRKALSKLLAYALSHNSRNIARYADGHIVYATQCRDYLEARMGVARDRIAVIPPAPPDVFLQSRPPGMTARRLSRILYVSQFAFFKAPMIVAEVINRLADANSDIGFTWVCSKEHHRDAIELLSVAARERLKLLDWMPQEALIETYDGHGIFLFPSFFEGFGKVFLEAMSRGLCVIAADNSGAHDVIVNGVNGILTPTGSIEAMTQACLGLLTDHGLAATLSTAAAETSRSYSWDRVATETVAFYENRLQAKARLRGC